MSPKLPRFGAEGAIVERFQKILSHNSKMKSEPYCHLWKMIFFKTGSFGKENWAILQNFGVKGFKKDLSIYLKFWNKIVHKNALKWFKGEIQLFHLKSVVKGEPMNIFAIIEVSILSENVFISPRNPLISMCLSVPNFSISVRTFKMNISASGYTLWTKNVPNFTSKSQKVP